MNVIRSAGLGGLMAATLVASAGCAGPLTLRDVARMDQAGDVDGLLRSWRSKPPDSVQPALIDALARYPESEETTAVIVLAARSHPREEVRQRAVARLAAFEAPEATTALIDALADPFPSVRGQAKAVLEPRSTEIFEALTVAARANRSPLVRAAVVDLLTRAAQREPSLRSAAVESLDDRARRDDAPRVRSNAAAGLGQLNVVGARGLLLEMMRTDDDSSTRMVAGRAFKKLLPPDEQSRSIVAVLPFKNDTGEAELDRYVEQVADLLIAELAKADVCEVVDPEQRDTAIAELRKTGIQLYDGDRPNAPQLGQFALADQLAFGVVQRTGLVYTVVINRMDVSTLKVVRGASVSVRGYRADLDRVKLESVRKFVARFR